MAENKEIKGLVQANNLREAFTILRDKSRRLSEVAITDRLNTMEQTYRFMIHYLMEGSADNNRALLHNELKEELLAIADKLEIAEQRETSPSHYFAEMRVMQMQPKNLEDLLMTYHEAHLEASFAEMAGSYSKEANKRAEQALLDIFSLVWTTPFLDREMQSLLLDTLCNPQSSTELKCQIISALLLGSLEYYDSSKLILLLDALNNSENADDLPVISRLLVAVMIISRLHDMAVSLNPGITSRMEAFLETPDAIYRLRIVVLNLVRAYDTDRINTKMKEDVIPRIMKMQPGIMKRIREAGKDLRNNPELNPEWEDILEKNGLGDKLRELQDLQMEGGDVMMMAFSNLKSFPFFSYTANWFLPFSPMHSGLDDFRALNNGAIEFLLGEGSVLCNSDRYSFALSLGHMPEEQRKMMFGTLNEQVERLKEEMESNIKSKEKTSFDNYTTRYVRDIYRFFRLSPRRNSFRDPFAETFDFLSVPVIGQALSDADTLNLMAEFYFKYGYFREARELFEKIAEMPDKTDAHLWEKIGYCYQAEGANLSALDNYRKAELLEPESRWLKRKLAYVYRITGNYFEATRYYQELLTSEPDNVSWLMSLGSCLTESGEWEKALKKYYQVHYLAPDNANAWRAIAWCEMQLGRHDKSRDFYNQLLLTGATAADYLNAGHQALVEGDLKRAVSLYCQSVKGRQQALADFMKDFKTDLGTLVRLGVDYSIIPILLDKISYDLQN